MTDKILNPAQLVCSRFGGIKEVARLLNLDFSVVYRWTCHPQGLIPSKYNKLLLELAVVHKVELSAIELIKGN